MLVQYSAKIHAIPSDQEVATTPLVDTVTALQEAVATLAETLDAGDFWVEANITVTPE